MLRGGKKKEKMKREMVIELWLAGFVLVVSLIVVVVLLGTAAADGPPMSERTHLSFSPIRNLLPTNNVYAFGHLSAVGNIIKKNKVDPLCNDQDGCYPYADGCEGRDYYCAGNGTGCNYTSSNRHTDSWVDTGNTRWVDENECKQKEQKGQEYRDYKCSEGNCNYSINDTKWIDTGIYNTTCIDVSLAPPEITSFAPLSYVDDTVGNGRTFNVTANQAANVSWYLNDMLVLTNESVQEAKCMLLAEVVGEHNVSAIASNAKGSDMQTWTWAVTSETQTIGTGTKTITQTIQVSNSFPMFSNAEYVYFTIGNDNITLTLDDTASFDGVCNLSDLTGRDVSVAGTTVELTYFPITYQGVSHDQKWVSAPFFDDTEHKLYLLAGSGIITKSRLMIEENSATTPIPKVVGVGSTVGQFQIETVAEGSNSNYNWLESTIKGVGYANIYAQYAPDTSYEKTPFLPTISQCEKLQGSIDSSISGSESKVAYQVDVLGVANGAEPISIVSHDWNLSLDLDVEYFPTTYQGVSHDQKWAVFPSFDDVEHKLYLLAGSGLITKSRLVIEENSAATPIPKVVGVGSTVGQFQIETVAEGSNSNYNWLESNIKGVGYANIYAQYAPDTSYEDITFIPTFSQCEQLQLNTNSNGSFIWYDAHVLGLATGVECLKFDGIPLDNVAIDETFDLTYHPVYISGDGFDEKWSVEPEQYEDILVILRGTGTLTELNFIFNDSTAAHPKIRSYGYLRGDYTITANILPHYMAVVANGADVAAMDESEQGGFGLQFGDDTTPPTVTTVSPEDGAPDVAIDTVVTATFSEAMDSSTITKDNFTLAGTPRRGWEEVPPVPPTESMVSGTVTYDGDTYTATFTPDAKLEYNHEYTATLSTAITDKAGNPLAEAYTWSFTTEPAPAQKTIYVDDDFIDDPANHKWNTIQKGVDDANDGDTIIVYPGTYTENVDVGKSVTIESEDGAEVTIVQAANPDDHVFEVTADYVTISGFTVRNAYEVERNAAGIKVISGNNVITRNNISNNADGISIESSNNTTIANNNIVGNRRHGIWLGYFGSNNILSNNISGNSATGICFWFAAGNSILGNNITDNGIGIYFASSSGSSLSNNNIAHNGVGISFMTRVGEYVTNTVYLNNFIENTRQITYPTETTCPVTNIWNSPSELTYTYNGNTYTNYLGNHWDDYIGSDANNDGIGDTPYPIDSDDDNYPLVERFENYVGEDTTPPTVTTVSPEDGAPDVAIDTVITATFSEAMDSSTITTDNFTLAGTPRRGWQEVPPVPPTESMVSGTVTYDGDTYTATFTPDAKLEYNHEYTATLSTAITDKAGNPLVEEYGWKFRTTKIEIGAIAKVINTGDSGLRIHKDDPTGETLKVVPDGWTFKIIGGPQYDIQDHNWWRTQEEKYEPSSIEGWVAEDFLRVAAPEDLVPGFPPDYFVSAQDTVEQAIEWAESKEGSSEWKGLCLKFVREAFQGELIVGWTSAEAARQQLEKEGKFYTQSNCWNPPRGALVFFSALGEYQPLGHVGLYLGNQGVVHSYDKVRVDTTENGVNKGIVIVERLNKIDSYIGWAYPPEKWIKKYDPKLTIPVYTPFCQQAHNGTELTYTINVTNNGTVTDTINLTVVDTRGWAPQLSDTSVRLAPGDFKHVHLSVTVKEEGATDRITITGTSRGDTSKTSKCQLKAWGLPTGCGFFAAILEFNKDPQEHTLNFNVPDYVKISDKEIILSSSEPKRVNVVFDPKPSQSNIHSIDIDVTDTITGESATVPIKFPEYEIIATNFDMAMDSYSFPNGIYKIETCYGMSETSILYFHHTIPLPGNNPNTYSLRRDEAKEKIIYHQNSLTNNVLAWRLRFFPWTIDADKEYKKLEANIGNGNPVFLCLKDHAVVAYKIVKKGDESYILIYENEKPYEISPNNFYLSFPYAMYNSISHEFDFGSYAKFLVQEAEKDIVTVEQALITSPTLTLMINCPVNVTIADQYNRIISDDGTNEIPNASIISTNEPKLFYLPAELTYFVNINAYDAGKFTLTITFPVTSTTVSLNVFSNISTTEKTQATLEIVPNMTNPMKIDYDGDGTIDEEKYPDMTEIIDVNQLPIASFTHSPAHPVVNETITFDASNSYDPDGTITKYEWNFGDGNISDTTEPIIIHSYASAGDYTVNLIVTDDDGATSSTSQLINVSAVPLPVLKIEKTSSSNQVSPGGTLTYTIDYCIEGGPVTNVIIVENYPKAVTFISADPAPDAGTNNKWTLGTLSAGSSGQIIIKVKVPESRDLTFTESGSVTGEGFVMVSKDISTEQKPYSLKNVVTLSCAELSSVSASASTTVSGVPGTSLEITEHGSGIYSSDEILNLQTKNKSIMLQKSTEAEYQPTSFRFSDGFAVNFATRWMQDICAKNMVMGDAMHKKIKDASYIEDETIAEVGGYRTSMEFESSFYGAAHIGTVSKSAKTSEDYIGAFEITWAEREECRYLFNWSRVPGNDSEKLIQFLVDVLDLGWAENATITKSADEMSIDITDNGNTATITIDQNKETATVKVGDEIIYVLEVRIEDDTLNIYDCKLEKMEESVSGIGYVMLDKDLASGQMQVREHGSGIYSSDMNFESGRLDKVTEAEYQPTSFNFSDDYAITFPSLWLQSICTKDKKAGTAIHKKISEAAFMVDDTTATKSSMEFESSFNGSMHIGARTKVTRISEDYIGVFNITQLIKIGKPAISTPSTPTPDWLPCPFPEPGVSTPPSDLECPSDP